MIECLNCFVKLMFYPCHQNFIPFNQNLINKKTHQPE
jgi:hypothetical protein